MTNTGWCPDCQASVSFCTCMKKRPDQSPKDVAGSRKVPFRYLLAAPLILVVRALAHGAKKYGPFNWRTGPKISRVAYLEAAIRHIVADLDGETIDPESGEERVPHVALAIAGLMVLLDADSLGQVNDDRGPAGIVGELIRAETKREPGA